MKNLWTWQKKNYCQGRTMLSRLDQRWKSTKYMLKWIQMTKYKSDFFFLFKFYKIEKQNIPQNINRTRNFGGPTLTTRMVLHWHQAQREFLREILYKNIAIIAIQHSEIYFVDTFGDFPHTVEWNSPKSVWQVSLYILAQTPRVGG